MYEAMNRPTSPASMRDVEGSKDGPAGLEAKRPEVVSVPITALSPGDTPRLKGEDSAHVTRLAQIELPLPPILVDRRTMRVIDGIHRLMAASLRGQENIEVEFFDGSPEDAFLRGVETNVAHGLPLSQADRTAAALRILVSHPNMSDRAIAGATGLGTRAIAELRRSTNAVPQLNARLGRDGKVRPLNGMEGRLRVAELIAEAPHASLRHVARIAGVSPATALDVRRRLERGEDPVPRRSKLASGKVSKKAPSEVTELTARGAGKAGPDAALGKLLRDPSMRQNEQGRQLLRMFKENAQGMTGMPEAVASVPSHCLSLATQIASHNSEMWRDLARELDMRAKIADPWSTRQMTASAE